MIGYDDFTKVDIRVGKVLSVEAYPEGKYSTHVLQLDFGSEIGHKQSLARLQPNYGGNEQQLVGRLVLAVVNFPPKQIGIKISEVLTLGVPDADGECILIMPDADVPLGGKLF